MGFFRNDGQNIPGYPLPVQSTVRGSNGVIYAVSSFGVDDTTFGPSFRPQSLVECDRHRMLDFRRAFYKCTQHDHKIYDMAGRMNRGGPVGLQQPLLSSQPPPFYVPLDNRRPNNPYRLARLIVQAFTNFIFGEGRFPKVRCVGDADAAGQQGAEQQPGDDDGRDEHDQATSVAVEAAGPRFRCGHRERRSVGYIRTSVVARPI